MLKSIRIYKTCRWNEAEKEREDYFKGTIEIEGKEGISAELELSEEDQKKMLKIISKSFKAALQTNIDELKELEIA